MRGQLSFGFVCVGIPQLTRRQIRVLTHLMVQPWIPLNRNQIRVLRNLIKKRCVEAEMSVDRPAIYKVTKVGEIARTLR